MAETLSEVTVTPLLKNCGLLLEGPHWHAPTQTLYFVDILGNTVHRYRPADDRHDEVHVGELVGTVVTTSSGRLMLACTCRFAYLDWPTGALTTVARVNDDEDESIRFNDGKCDKKGRFWAGTMALVDPKTKKRPSRLGALYCLHPDKSVTKHLEDVDISNGLAWTQDNKTMYYIDTMTRLVQAFDFIPETGQMSNRRAAVRVPDEDGLPDGMCIDNEGMVWVASFGEARITRFNPKTGEKLRTIKFPASFITSCCFGGPELDELFVTSSRVDINDELIDLNQQPLAGSLFKVTGLGVKGFPGADFND